jgi:DNA-binding MarR family transcriptional regulator
MKPDDAPPRRLRGTLSWLLTHAAAPAQRLVTEAMAAAGARGYHYALLSALDEYGPASQAALGRRCGIDRSDVAAALDQLAALGQVERRRDPTDGRRNIVAITSSGTEQLRRLDEALAQVQDELFAPLSSEERAHLAGLLVRVVDCHAER